MNNDTKSFLIKNYVRIIAGIALVFVMIGVWYWGKHPRQISSHPPAQPYQYAVVQAKPIGQPYPAQTPADTFYTIQMLGSHQRAEAAGYIQQHKLQQGAKIYQETYQSKPWYIVGYGHYPSRQAAATAMHQSSIKSGWVRPMHQKTRYLPLMEISAPTN